MPVLPVEWFVEINMERLQTIDTNTFIGICARFRKPSEKFAVCANFQGDGRSLTITTHKGLFYILSFCWQVRVRLSSAEI